MATDATIKKSLEFHKSALAGVLKTNLLKYVVCHDESLGNVIKETLFCDPKSLEDAARFFGLDHTSLPHREILLRLLTQAIFGKKTRGPKKGKAPTWSFARKVILGGVDHELRRKNPKMSNEKIAAVISEKVEIFKAYRKDPRAIRKQLPAARREYIRWERMCAHNRDLQRELPDFVPDPDLV
jgi:hypothetical protein